MNTVKTEQIKLYAFTQKFRTKDGVVVFGGHLSATSAAQAEQLSRQIGAEFDGLLLSSVCARCGQVEYFNDSDDDDDSILDWECLN